MKLISKEKIKSKYRKKYDTPQTPYQRLLAAGHISKESEERLAMIYKTINPFTLRKNIETKEDLRNKQNFLSG